MTTNDARLEPVQIWPAALAFAVVYVPMVAFPLAGVVRAGQVLEARLRPDRR